MQKNKLLSFLPLFGLIVTLLSGCQSNIGSSDIEVKVISDDSGGALVSWWDKDNKSIHIQHINTEGNALWGSGGLIAAHGVAYNYSMIPDGQGGTIITWQQDITYTSSSYALWRITYSQRIDGDGKLFWSDGVPTGVIGRGNFSPPVIPDGKGGIIFTWDDSPEDVQTDALKVQKLNPDGRNLWGEQGILIASGHDGLGYHGGQKIFDDGSGGVLVLWEQADKYPGPNYNLFAQRIDAHGKIVWVNPKSVNEQFNDYYCVSSMALGKEKILLALGNSKGSESDTIFLCIDMDTNLLWKQTVSNEDGFLSLWPWIGDGLGGVIFTRYKSTFQGPDRPWTGWTYLQKLNQESSALWDDNQPILTSNERANISYSLVSDGIGGAVLTWCVKGKNNTFGDIFAQNFDSDGRIKWAQNKDAGVRVLASDSLKYRGKPEIVNADSDSVIIVATAGQTAYLGDLIYAQKLDSNGNSVWGEGVKIDR